MNSEYFHPEFHITAKYIKFEMSFQIRYIKCGTSFGISRFGDQEAILEMFECLLAQLVPCLLIASIEPTPGQAV